MNKFNIDNNKKLYEFLATSYDISLLASKIDASQKSELNVWKLKKMVNDSDVAIA